MIIIFTAPRKQLKFRNYYSILTAKLIEVLMNVVQIYQI